MGEALQNMRKDYFGTKRITAWPEEKYGVPGYAVTYPSGHNSWVPKEVFEEAYQPLTKMSFEHALFAVKRGAGMRLPHWQEDVIVRMQSVDANSKMTHPYLYAESRFRRVPWTATMVELFAENWTIVE